VILLVCSFSIICCAKPKAYRVGILSGLNFFAEITDGFQARMTELGYREGQDITYDVQKTDFDMAAYDRILKKFTEDKVDLILVFPTEASQQAKKATEGTGIPVVFVNAFTEGTGLVDSVQEPGGNITGVRWPGPEIVARSFDILMELAPRTRRMWIIYQRGYPIVQSQLDTLRPLAASTNVTLVEIPVNSPRELDAELRKRTGPFDADAINMISEPLLSTPQGFATVAKFAAQHNIPLGGGPIFEGDYPSLYGLVPESVPQGREAAFLADKIFKGTPAGKIPVITAEHVFILNYRQAKKMKLNITERLMGQAEKVIR
jgi:putative ABC transport system substrate-binding protein